MGQAKGAFFLGASPSIADVAVFEIIDFFQEIAASVPADSFQNIFRVAASVPAQARFEEVFKPFPAVLRCYKETRAIGRLAEHCDSRKTYATWDEQSQTP